MSKSENVPIMARAIPAGFDPMKLLRRMVSQSGEDVLRLELPYKKLWFRKSHPNGRIYVKPLQLNEKIAIYEAQVFLNREDNVPISSFTASVASEGTPDGSYAEKAQYEAVDNALTDAGFGIQVADRYYGSEIPVSVYPGTAPKAVRKPVTKPVQTTAKTVVQPPAVAEQTVPAAQVKTVVSTAQPASQTGVPTDGKTEPAAIPKVETVTAPKVETVAAPKVEAPVKEETVVKAEPVVQAVSQPTQVTEPVQPVVAPVVNTAPQQEVHAANAALELLRSNTSQPAAAQATPADSDLPFTFGPTYNNEMSVEQIVGLMTLEQAKAVVVDDGMSKGMTMGEVAEKRPASLQFYLSVGYKKNNNILKAAAQILLNERQKAS